MEVAGDSFLEWAAKLGISDSPRKFIIDPETPRLSLGHSLCISDFPQAGGRGLGAVRDIRKGELVLTVPKSALITTETLLLKDENLSLAVKSHPTLSSTQILTLCLLVEMGKGKSSCWHPYLMQLPRSYDLLASFGQHEAQALQVDEAIWIAERAASKAEQEWKEAIDLLKKLGLKTQLQSLRAWLWASATISSRTLHLPWDDAGCLCPVGDLFNYAAPGEETFDCDGAGIEADNHPLQVGSLGSGHSEEKVGLEHFDDHVQRLVDAEYDEDVSAYCFYARKNYKKGEQVFLGYGIYTNLELLEHYGFLLNDNPNDKVFLPLLPEILSSNSWPRDSLHISQNGEPSFALLCALRLWATPPSHRRFVKHIAYSGSQLSVENEISVMNWITEKCRVILKSLPTSVEDDSILVHTINKMQDSCARVELKKLQSAVKGELGMLLKADSMLLQGGSEVSLSGKTRRAIDRWKLAIEWRMRHKRTLGNCISYCSQTINCLRV